MTEQDAKYVEGIKAGLQRQPEEASILVVKRLIEVIDRLDKQLAALKEVGKPFRMFYETNDMIHLPGNCGLVWRQKGTTVTVDDFSRLAQALKEIE